MFSDLFPNKMNYTTVVISVLHVELYKFNKQISVIDGFIWLIEIL